MRHGADLNEALWFRYGGQHLRHPTCGATDNVSGTRRITHRIANTTRIGDLRVNVLLAVPDAEAPTPGNCGASPPMSNAKPASERVVFPFYCPDQDLLCGRQLSSVVFVAMVIWRGHLPLILVALLLAVAAMLCRSDQVSGRGDS